MWIFLDGKGNEITDCFGYLPGTPIVSFFEFGQPSPICLKAIEDSTLISIPIDVVVPLLTAYSELLLLYNRLLQEALKRHWEDKIALMQYSAMERYQWFLQRYPGLIDRISHRYVASYLGITPVSLSRIRRTLRENPSVL